MIQVNKIARSNSGVLALIPARGGSKGLPGKNIKEFCGKPLIAWTIEAALSCSFIDQVVLSSDDDAIINVALNYGSEVPFKRDSSLAGDCVLTVDVVLDALNRCPDAVTVIVLQPTSPLRTGEDIAGAFEMFLDRGARSCASVCVAPKSPNWMFSISNDTRLIPILEGATAQRRQELQTTYVLNGAIYIADTKWLKSSHCLIDKNTIGMVMDQSRSIDIDSITDFEIAEFMYYRNKRVGF